MVTLVTNDNSYYKWQFLSKVTILVKSDNSCQKWQYLPKVTILVTSDNTCHKWQYLSQVTILVKSDNTSHSDPTDKNFLRASINLYKHTFRIAKMHLNNILREQPNCWSRTRQKILNVTVWSNKIYSITEDIYKSVDSYCQDLKTSWYCITHKHKAPMTVLLHRNTFPNEFLGVADCRTGTSNHIIP